MKLVTISLLTTLALSLFGASGIAADSPSEAKSAEGKPNIVLILMDNLGYGELGCYGGGILRGASTPRIDKLASEGMRLLNYNVEAQCTPSRAALMTGRYAFRTGNGSVPIDTPRYGRSPLAASLGNSIWHPTKIGAKQVFLEGNRTLGIRRLTVTGQDLFEGVRT